MGYWKKKPSSALGRRPNSAHTERARPPDSGRWRLTPMSKLRPAEGRFICCSDWTTASTSALESWALRASGPHCAATIDAGLLTFWPQFLHRPLLHYRDDRHACQAFFCGRRLLRRFCTSATHVWPRLPAWVGLSGTSSQSSLFPGGPKGHEELPRRFGRVPFCRRARTAGPQSTCRRRAIAAMATERGSPQPRLSTPTGRAPAQTSSSWSFGHRSSPGGPTRHGELPQKHRSVHGITIL